MSRGGLSRNPRQVPTVDGDGNERAGLPAKEEAVGVQLV